MKAEVIMQREFKIDLKIVDVLSTLNRPISIRKLTRIVKEFYGSGNYANIHKKIHEMQSKEASVILTE